MRVDFTPTFQRSVVAAGIGIAGVGIGAYQAIHGASVASKGQKALERQANEAPQYNNRSVNDYYQQALNRYNVDPSNTLQYQRAQQAVNNNLATGINALHNGRAAGNLPRLIAASDNQLNNAGVQAEQQRNQRFNELGRASQMKAGDDRYAFNVNKEQPYQRQYSLTAAMASGGNREESAGIQNVFSGANSLAAMSNSGMFNRSDGTSVFSKKNPYKLGNAGDNSTGYNPANGGYTIY
jgi:hypothetical protein